MTLQAFCSKNIVAADFLRLKMKMYGGTVAFGLNKGCF